MAVDSASDARVATPTRPQPGGKVQSPRGSGAWAAALLLALLAGCATQGGLPERMDRFIGQPLDAAKLAIGSGYAERTAADGTRLLSWTWFEPGTTPGYRTPDTVISVGKGRAAIMLPGEQPRFDRETAGLCEITFLADPGGTIQNWQAIGTGCLGRVP